MDNEWMQLDSKNMIRPSHTWMAIAFINDNFMHKYY